MVPRRETPNPNVVNNLCNKCGQQGALILNENFQVRPNQLEANSRYIKLRDACNTGHSWNIDYHKLEYPALSTA